MAGISLLLGEGFVALPIEQTMVWAVFYATLFWLPVRGVAAVFQRRSADAGDYKLRHQEQLASSRPVYHVGMKILPPF
jgi:hypothetical protein